MSKAVFCNRCKVKIGEHIRFCPKCGNDNKPQFEKIRKNNSLKMLIPIIIIITVTLLGLYAIKNKKVEIPVTTKEQVTPSLLPFDENGKWGYMNTTGKVVIKPKYDWADEFSEGLAAVMLYEKYGYINEKGEVVIDIEYDEVGNVTADKLYEDYKFSNGLVGVCKNNKYYMMDKEGNIVTKDYIDSDFSSYELILGTSGDASRFSSYAYDQYYSLSEGMSIYKDINSEKYGYVNEDGNVVIEAQFDWAWRFSEGLAAVIKDELLGFINQKGEVVIDYQFEANKGEHIEFSEGLVAVKKDDKYGYINQKGKFIIENKYEYAGEFVNGKALVLLNDEMISELYDKLEQNEYVVGYTEATYIDTNGDIVIEDLKLPIYYDNSREDNFSNGVIPVYKNGKVVYVSEDGTTTSDYAFNWATSFQGKVARVVLDNESVWINDEFKVIVPYQGVMDIEEYLDYKEDKFNREIDNAIQIDEDILYDTDTLNSLIKNRVKEYEESYVSAVNTGNFYILEPNLLYYGSMYEQFRDIVDDYYSRNLKLKLYNHRVDNITDIGDGEYRVNIYEEFGVTINGGEENIKKFDSIYIVKIEDGECYMKDINQ